MNFLADANIPRQIVESLKAEGHNVMFVAEMEPGISDEVVLEIANTEQAVLITADTDFGELIFRQSRASVGVILIRLHELSLQQRAEVVTLAVREHQARFAKAFTVISPGRIRIRQQM